MADLGFIKQIQLPTGDTAKLEAYNALTFNNSGSGAASGITYNGKVAQIISYNTIGAIPASIGTAKGSMIYFSGANTVAEIIPNTANSIKFLSMEGTGSAGAAPTWTVLNSASVGLGNVENTALSTWAGTNNINTVGTISSGTWNGTTIATTKGGTGLDSYTQGDLIYASAANTLSKLAASTNGAFLTLSNGLPAWTSLPTASTSSAGIVQLSDAINSTSTALAATANAVKTAYDLANAAIPKSIGDTEGDLLYYNGTSWVKLNAGSNGQYLKLSDGVPVWGNDNIGANYLPLLGGTLTGSIHVNRQEYSDGGSFLKLTSNEKTLGIHVGSGGNNRGLYDWTAGKWMIYANDSDVVTVNGNCTGNAATASTWATARNFTIGATAKSVNGSIAVTWTDNEVGFFDLATAGTMLDSGTNIDTMTTYGNFYVPNSASMGNLTGTLPWTGAGGRIINMHGYATNYDRQFGFGSNYYIYTRHKSSGTWQAWKTLAFTDGTGASGTWGISITGSSASCTGHAASDLALTGGTISGDITVHSCFNTYSESVTSGTTAGVRAGIMVYGQTYGNIAAYIKTAGKLSYGDPGPQIIFGLNTTRTSAQKIALIYTDHDTIATGNSLSLVSTESNASFIAPTIKALTGFVGNVTGNCSGSSASCTGNAATATATNSFATIGSSSTTHATALQNYFNSNKANIPRNKLIAFYDSTGGNGSLDFGYFLSGYDSSPYGGFFSCHYNTAYYIGISNGSYSVRQIWTKGDAVTGAVWNDYAEYREVTTNEPGYVVYENGDDTLSPTQLRMQHFAGVTSDTWGFAQGETEKAKTPIAVAGRVLVYTYHPRDWYQPGDCVCAAPGGTVDIMTQDEIIMHPDRIVGTVSCVPTYEEWGGGENADRKPIKVNGRIWIKVR